MSDSFITAVKHSHTMLVILFTLHYLLKTFLYFSGNKLVLASYQSKTKVAFDMIVPTLFIITGVILIVKIGMGNIGGWFHLKLLVVLFLIPMSIIGFRKEIKPMIIISCLLFVYIVLLAFLKKPLLFF